MIKVTIIKLQFRHLACKTINLKIKYSENKLIVNTTEPFKRQPHKIVKFTQTIRQQFADTLFECV